MCFEHYQNMKQKLHFGNSIAFLNLADTEKEKINGFSSSIIISWPLGANKLACYIGVSCLFRLLQCIRHSPPVINIDHTLLTFQRCNKLRHCHNYRLYRYCHRYRCCYRYRLCHRHRRCHRSLLSLSSSAQHQRHSQRQHHRHPHHEDEN